MPVIAEYNLTGKIAFMAGEGDGLTPMIARTLAEAGAKVFILGPHQSIVEGSMLEVANIGGDSMGLFGDPSDPIALDTALSAVLNLWGRVDILVNNTRIHFAKPFEEVSASEWQEVMRQNVGAAFLLCNRIGKEMLKQGNGKIINIISGLAERGLWNSAAFCSSQGAILQLTRTLALEWARRNIQVNAIGVGWIDNEDMSVPQDQQELLLRYIPVKRKGTPEDIAPLVVYLSSDSCEFTTGQPIYLDGGLMSHP